MKIDIDKSLGKDAKKLSKQVQQELKELILKLEKSENLEAFDTKKLSGYKNAYRIRLGNYRIGYYLENGVIILSRIAKRNDIYSLFPDK